MTCPNEGRGLSCPYQDGYLCRHPLNENDICEFEEGGQ